MNGMLNGTVATYFLYKQMLVDLAGMLEGNVTSVLRATIDLVSAQAGVLYDIERILEKVIDLLIS